MAERTHSYAENVPGRFYVDDSCIDCDMCLATAPDNFERNQGRRYCYIAKQPENDEEWALCLQAMEECPVSAIGCDKDVAEKMTIAGSVG
jgi:ferredoxin